MAINVLPTSLANKISAGEVVERPASIVKELLDNAIDAGASEISVEIKNGGIDYIRVIDNGSGIEESDVKKAFLPHATSKISSLEDLDNIYTLGFRGEALASIASVSQVTIETKTNNDELSSNLEIEGGIYGKEGKSAGKNGTSIEVKNLFFNTPARRKFLRKPKQEENEITNVVSRYILAHPGVKIKYYVEDVLSLNCKGSGLLDAIGCVYGYDNIQNVLHVDGWSENIHVFGYVSKLSYTKPNTTYQTLLVNNRYVVDESVSKAVYMAYEEFLMPRQFPFFVLNIDLPYGDVDVNVHPNKLSIKFAKPNTIFDFVYNLVRKTIHDFIRPKSPQIDEFVDVKKEEDEVVEVTYETPLFKSDDIIFRQSFGSNISLFDKVATNSEYDNTPFEIKTQKDVAKSQDEARETVKTEPSHEEASYSPIADFSKFKVIGEIFEEFLVLEHEDKMILLDFHAGHERLLYDKLIKEMANKKVVVQDLLVPYTQTLTPKEIDYILQFRENFLKLGFDIDQFSANAIRISSVPLLVKDINLKNFVEDLVNDLNNMKPKVAYEIDSYLMRTACRSAVKAGQTLNELQINELLKNLDINHPVLLCPHGRPIVSIISRSQIEKWFKRIV